MGNCQGGAPVAPAIKYASPKLLPPKSSTHQLVHTESLKNLLAPPKDARASGTWMLPDLDWDMGMDENGNAYFYNTLTGQSSWDPPKSLQHLDLPTKRLSFIVTIPTHAIPGQAFIHEIDNGACLNIMCPLDALPGEQLELLCPDESSQDAIVYDVDYDTTEESSSESEVDPYVAWSNLAADKDLDLYTVETDVSTAKAVVNRVSGGCYTASLLHQVAWAYQLNQLELALKDCIKVGGNFDDCSKYDNCDGIPRYEGGFAEWWADIRSKREKTIALMESGVVGGADLPFFERLSSDYSSLEALVLSGDEQTLLSGLIERQKQVESELENLHARSLAIVSIEGGPSEESLDKVYHYIREQMTGVWENCDYYMDVDELEELMSSTLQERHRFVVDDIIQLVMLEEELKNLVDSIKNFKSAGSRDISGKSMELENAQDVTNESGSSNTCDVADCDRYDDENPNTNILRNLIAQQEVESLRLEESLLAEKAEKTKALEERLAKRRHERMNELMRQNSMSIEEADVIVHAEIAEEEATELGKYENEVTDKMKRFYNDALESLRQNGAKEAERLSDELALQKQQKLDALASRLQQRREKTETALSSGIDVNNESLAHEIDEISFEGYQEAIEIETNALEETREKRKQVLDLIRAEHDAQCQRLENELNSKREKKKLELRSKIEKKIALKAKEMAVSSAETECALTSLEALALAKYQFSAELTEGTQSIDDNVNAELQEEKELIIAALKELHRSEFEKLDIRLKISEDSQREHLQQRLKTRRVDREMQAARSLSEETTHHDYSTKNDKNLMEQDGRDEEKLLEESLARLKDKHSEHSKRLINDLENTKSMHNRALRDRLEQKKQRQIREKDSKELSSIDDVIKNLRSKHQVLLQRLVNFLGMKKDSELSAQKSGSQNDIAKVLMLYNTIQESLVNGFKKKCYYEIKLAKEKQDVLDLAYYESKVFQDNAASNSTDQLLSRLSRDICGHFESQYSERVDIIRGLQDNSAPRTRVMDAEASHDERCQENSQLVMQKAIFTLTAISLHSEWLLEGVSIDKLEEVATISETEDEMYLEEKSNCNSMTFGHSLFQWFDSTRHIVQTLTDATSIFSMHLSEAHTAVDMGAASDSDKQLEISRYLRFHLMKPLALPVLQLCLNSMNQFDSNGTLATLDKTAVECALRSSFGLVESNAEILSIFAASRGLQIASPVKTHLLPSEARSISPGPTKDSSLVVDLYKKAIEKYLFDPLISIKLLRGQKQHIKTMIRQQSSLMRQKSQVVRTSTKSSSNTVSNVPKRREDTMVEQLNQCVERKKREVSRESESGALLSLYDVGYAQVRSMILSDGGANTISCMSIDGLMLVVEKIVQGENIHRIDFPGVQKEAEKMESRRQAQNVIMQAKQNEERLDIALKMEKARKQQQLQKRLMAKSKAKIARNDHSTNL